MERTDQSTFLSGTANGVWWQTRASGVVYTCSTSGGTFIRLLQDTLRNSITSTAVSFDNRNVIGSDVVSDAQWGPTTQRALYVALRNAFAPQVLLDTVRADGTNRQISRGSVAAAIWLFHRQGFGPVPAGIPGDNIVLPDNVVLPRWSTAPPVSELPPAGIFCERDGVESVPAGEDPPPVVPGDTPRLETPPVAPPPGVAPPPDVVLPLPPGILVQTQRAANSGVNWGLVAAAVGVVAVIAVIASQTAKGPPTQTTTMSKKGSK